ncbi:MAG: DUF975 family protein [Firmicutes bacterium]|nr:DUF975 family protein [Bacillota bacterium]
MGYYIIKEPVSKIREIARNTLRGYWKPVVLAIFIYYMVSAGVSTILDYFFTFTPPLEIYGEVLYVDMPFGGSIYTFIIGGPLEFGLTMYLLAFFRAKQTDNTLLFEGFSNFGKSFLLMLLITVKVFLWSLLFIIPGIIASYKYSQAFYVMIDNPQLTPGQCIKESCRIMNGNKATLFILELTFIGWSLLASIPAAVFTTVEANGVYTLTSAITAIILGIPAVIVDAYILTANTAFYELATRRLVVVSDYDPENVVDAEYTVNENQEHKDDENL